MPLSDKEAEWISKRKRRWQILLKLRANAISISEAEKRLRELDAR